mmetsp:Transcript_11543/g.30556  ORF Transcript_11543/g.30556 Transcript_11543/m.30556 type:complete len:212 (-) Transcript_11543:839-1474(-)
MVDAATNTTTAATNGSSSSSSSNAFSTVVSATTTVHAVHAAAAAVSFSTSSSPSSCCRHVYQRTLPRVGQGARLACRRLLTSFRNCRVCVSSELRCAETRGNARASRRDARTGTSLRLHVWEAKCHRVVSRSSPASAHDGSVGRRREERREPSSVCYTASRAHRCKSSPSHRRWLGHQRQVASRGKSSANVRSPSCAKSALSRRPFPRRCR